MGNLVSKPSLPHHKTCFFWDSIFPSVQWGPQRTLKAERLLALGQIGVGGGLASKAEVRVLVTSSSEEDIVPMGWACPGGLPRGGKEQTRAMVS